MIVPIEGPCYLLQCFEVNFADWFEKTAGISLFLA